MSISFDKALGGLPQQLSVFSERSSLLASNIANADTPGFKARDIDFKAMLSKASAGGSLAMQTTRANHLGGPSMNGLSGDALYRTPTQPSLDGNTVNSQVEQAQFAENSLRYQSTLTFLNGRIKGLMLAIRGE